MASPLDNTNAPPQPSAALFDHGAQQLAFGRPVQPLDHVGKRPIVPGRVPVPPLPAVRKQREACFVKACRAGDEATVQHLLSVAPDLTAYENYADLLEEVVEKGDSGLTDLLLEFKKADTDQYMLLLETAAKKATIEGHIDMVRGLLQKGAPVHDHRISLLHLAVIQSHRTIAEMLVRAGVDMEANAQNCLYQSTPLTCAMTNNDDLCTRWLLKQGADPNRRPGNTGRPPLAWACYYGDLSKVKILLAAGALIDRGAHEGPTPLAIAVQHGKEQVARHLLQVGADVNAACQPQQSPLYKAVLHNRRELSKVLLEAGAAPDLRCTQEVKQTPLILAVQEGYYLLAELLVDHGADMSRKGPEGFSALEIAARFGFYEIVVMLRAKAAQQAARPGGSRA